MAKPRKVEEPATPYVTPKSDGKNLPSRVGVRVADLSEVKKTNAKLMQVHRKVLQKLAQ